MKKEVITAFISRYHVSPQQAAVLKRSDDIDTEFFTVLDRVRTIHQDCKILLQTHQTTGLQIMENMAHLQEQAFQSLFKWTQVLLLAQVSFNILKPCCCNNFFSIFDILTLDNECILTLERM